LRYVGEILFVEWEMVPAEPMLPDFDESAPLWILVRKLAFITQILNQMLVSELERLDLEATARCVVAFSFARLLCLFISRHACHDGTTPPARQVPA
jgi:hypothetical protein